MKHSTTPAKRKIIPFLFATAWIMLWQLSYWAIDTPLLLASPAEVMTRLVSLAQTEEFWITIFSSLGRILIGFFCSLAAGCLLAWFACAFPLLRDFLRPPVAVIRATPVASFIILALVWIKSNNLSVFISFLMVLPMIYENICKGIESVDPLLLEMAEVYRFSFLKKLRFLYLPAILPFFLSACINGLGFAWKSGIAAEVIGLPKHAIGRHIYESKIYIEIPDLFAWTVVVILLSMLLERLFLKLMALIEHRVLRSGKELL